MVTGGASATKRRAERRRPDDRSGSRAGGGGGTYGEGGTGAHVGCAYVGVQCPGGAVDAIEVPGESVGDGGMGGWN